MESIILFAFATFFGGFFGAMLPLTWLRSRTWLREIIAISTGLILGVVFLHLIPEIPFQRDAIYFFAGFIVFYLIEHVAMIHTCDEHSCHQHSLGFATFLALAAHAFIDGVAIAVSDLIDHGLGFAVFLAILMHKLPASLSLVSIMSFAKIEVSKIRLLTFIFAIATPIGLALTLWLFKYQPYVYLGPALAFSGGTMLYIGASDLLPGVHARTAESKQPRMIVLVLTGIAIAWGMGFIGQ